MINYIIRVSYMYVHAISIPIIPVFPKPPREPKKNVNLNRSTGVQWFAANHGRPFDIPWAD